LMTAVNGLSATSSTNGARAHIQQVQHMAEMWARSNKQQAALATQNQKFAHSLEIRESDKLSIEQMQQLMQDVQKFASSAQERYRLELQTGQDATTRSYHHRRILEAIQKNNKMHEHITALRGKGQNRTYMVADSTVKLVLVEVVQALATGGSWYMGQSSTWKHGVALVAMYFASSVCVFMDAGFSLEEAIHTTWTIPTTNGWGDWSYDNYGIDDIKPMQIWMTLHVAMSGLVGCLGLQSIFDNLLWDRLDLAVKDINPDNYEAVEGENRAWMMGHVALWLAATAAGGIFYSNYEACTCSYGVSAVPGCMEDDCENTGGIKMDLVDSVYMMVLSLGSVGYGDFSPKTFLGRWIGFPLFLLGNSQRFHVMGLFSEGLGYLFGKPRDGGHGRYE